MFNIPTVLTAQELTDKVLRRATKVTVDDPHAMYRIKKLSIARLDSIDGNLDSTLKRYIDSFPSIDIENGTVDMDGFFDSFIRKHGPDITQDDLEFLATQRISFSRFYFSLMDITSDARKIKKSLSSLKWAIRKCQEIINKKQKQIRRMSRIPIMDTARKEAIGRISSVIRQIGPALAHLGMAREHIRKFPTLSPGASICVIAGYPNVGKSSLLKQISNARPEIASYPFTTRGINMGVYETSRGLKDGLCSSRINLVDTPGLLDRSPEERNEIEMQAAAALSHIADCILFILDPSEYCGYPLSAQNGLLDALREMFTDVPFIIVENKCDALRSDTDLPKISTLTGEGIEKVLEKMESTALASSGIS